MGRIIFSQAVDGHLLYAHSRRLSEHTVADYRYTFKRFQRFLAPEDPSMNSISLDVIEVFLTGMDGFSRKTILNYHTRLLALWTWAVKRDVAHQHIRCNGRAKVRHRPRDMTKFRMFVNNRMCGQLGDAVLTFL